MMQTAMYSLKLKSQRAPEFIDITQQVRDCVSQTNVNTGFVVVFSKHTTAAVTINENEPLLLEDMEQFLERIAPRQGTYRHNDFSVRTVNMTPEETPNGHAHCQNLLFHTSETIPIVQGSPQFGRWQSLFFVELDHPRSREVVVQVMGE
jgi:secondary thiamine-phosphate synthase enzyme